MRRIFIAGLAVLALASSARAQTVLLKTDGYGTLTGTVKFDGPLPAVIDLIPAMKAKDPVCCLSKKMKPEEMVDMKWMIDPKTRAVQNVIVWVVAPKKTYFPTPDQFKNRAKDVVEFDQPHFAYLPRIAAHQPVYIDGGKEVKTGQKVVFKNSAVSSHNVLNVGNATNDGWNKTLPSKTEIEETFNPSRLPLTLQCSIHPWMSARLAIFDHPFYAITDAKGRFEIPMVPAGAEVTVMAWHEDRGFLLYRQENSKDVAGQLKTFEKGKTTTIDFSIK